MRISWDHPIATQHVYPLVPVLGNGPYQIENSDSDGLQ